MRERLESLGCLVLALAVLFFSAAAGWGIHQVFEKIRWMPDWINVSLSAVIGVVVLIILGLILISYITTVMLDINYEE